MGRKRLGKNRAVQNNLKGLSAELQSDFCALHMAQKDCPMRVSTEHGY